MTVEARVNRALELLKNAHRVVALTGAGISTASGIPDFRSPSSGLWQGVDPLEVASIYAFRHRPQDFYDWIRPVARITIEAEPNPAHLALAQLEMHGPLQAVITQNIDMLHSRAGSQNVQEVHGHLREVTCLRCYSIFLARPYLDVFLADGQVPRCELCGGVLKPNVILFGEQLPIKVLNTAKKLARECDLMIVAGSSLEVAPAGDLPLLAVGAGARLVIVNFQATHLDYLADVVVHSDVVDVLPRFAALFRPA
jgi:NAD-dependent deacetylase